MEELYQYVSSLIMYNASRQDTVLERLSELIKDYEQNPTSGMNPRAKINDEIHRILEIATTYGFTENLWKSYIAFLMATDENPFSILCEMEGAAKDASANVIVKKDMDNFYRIYNYSFAKAESVIGTDCFSILSDYKSMHKDENTYNIGVSECVKELRHELDGAGSGDDFFEIITSFYKKYGVGKFGLNKAFRVVGREESQAISSGFTRSTYHLSGKSTGDESIKLAPGFVSAEVTQNNLAGYPYIEAITNTSDVTLDHLVGYESQKERLIENTEAFVVGRPANNCLLYGDAGTGKSTCIKAILNMYYDRGLRLIELYKHQFRELSSVIRQIKNRNYKFIIYMDDLSFEEFETDYKYLKAVIEGGMEVRPANVLIYATSNRRHLIRETWSDRPSIENDEVNRFDTMQEKLSLASRFGVSISFEKPSKNLYNEIVISLAKEAGIEFDIDDLLARANVWSLRNGGYSGRTAEQFVISLLTGGE